MTAIWKTPQGRQAVLDAYAGIRAAWPVPREELRLPTRHGETFVVASGDPARPPLVLLHGAGSNAFMWMGDVAAWAEHFRVYAVDVIGEPTESAPSRPPRDGPAYAEWLDDVMAGLGLERAAFVGLSLGGWLTLDYAIRRPERVERLAVLCPGGVGAVKLSFLLRASLLAFSGPKGRKKILDAAGARELPAPIAAFLALIYTHFIPRRDPLPIFPDAALAGLGMPILAIVGARDTLIDSAGTQRRLARAAPHARIVMLPEAGHFLAGQTAPVLAFLREGVA